MFTPTSILPPSMGRKERLKSSSILHYFFEKKYTHDFITKNGRHKGRVG